MRGSKMFRRGMALLLVLMLVMGMTVGCGGTEEAAPAETAPAEGEAAVAEQGKVGFIYVGPIGDGGWTYAHDQARLYLEDTMGVATLYRESVPEDAEVEKSCNGYDRPRRNSYLCNKLWLHGLLRKNV